MVVIEMVMFDAIGSMQQKLMSQVRLLSYLVIVIVMRVTPYTPAVVSDIDSLLIRSLHGSWYALCTLVNSLQTILTFFSSLSMLVLAMYTTFSH